MAKKVDVVTIPELDGRGFLLEPNLSEWECHLFGGDMMGLVWRPNKGKHPCWFWRKMQWLFFGNKWVRVKK